MPASRASRLDETGYQVACQGAFFANLPSIASDFESFGLLHRLTICCMTRISGVFAAAQSCPPLRWAFSSLSCRFPATRCSAALLALLLRVNVAIAAVTTFVSNPLTIGPDVLFRLSAGSDLARTCRAAAVRTSNCRCPGSADQFLLIWQPMVLGCVLLGSRRGLARLCRADLLWRASIADYLAKRRET